MIVEYITADEPKDHRRLAKIIASRTDPGEYTLSPIEPRTFDRWLKTVKDINLPLQYTDNALTWLVMLKSHYGTAAVVVDQVIKQVLRVMPTLDTALNVQLVNHTGLFDLRAPGKKSKNADACIFTFESGKEFFWPGIVVEVGYSETLRRDVSLWIDYADCNIKSAICVKINVANSKITKLIYEFWEMDWSYRSRTQPIGRSKKILTLDFSDESKPPTTQTHTFPSYHLFPDGVYPPEYPPHPSPPTPELHATLDDFDVNKQPSGYQLRLYNKEIDLRNTQRMPVTVDFAVISSKIRNLSLSK